MNNKIFKFLSLVLFLFSLSGFRTNIAFKKAQQSKLVITTAAQNIFIGNCSDAISVQSQSTSGNPQNPASNLTVNLTTSGSMQFYSDSACTNSISNITIYAGSSSNSFYFMFTALGSETITAAASGYSSAAQAETAATNPFVWTGGGGNINWNNGANWAGGMSPSSTSHYAIFDSSCVSNCSPTINASISIGGVRVKSGYSGTITLGSGNNLTIDAKGWVQAAGTFAGGNGAVTINGVSKISAGTFTSTSGNLTINKDFTVSGGTFNHNSGKVIFSGTGYPINYALNGLTFNNVDFIEAAWGTIDLAGGSFTVNGNLKLDGLSGCGSYCSIENGTIKVKGNINIVNDGFYGAATIKLIGSSNQTIDGSLANATGRLPSLEIASTGGTVSLVGNVGVNKNYTFTSGTVNSGTSSLNFIGNDQNITPGTATYYNVTMSNVNWQQKTLLGGTMTVANDLYLSTVIGCGLCNLDNGTINVGRNVTVDNGGYRGSAVINMNGSTNAVYTIIGGSNIPSGSVTINKSSSTNTVTLASNMPLTNTSQALTITSGILDLSGYTLSVNSALTIGAAGSLLCNGGSYTSGSLSNSGTIDCAGYPFNWTGGGANANWNTAANWAGGVAPNSTQVAIFKDAYCGAKCNATITADPNVKGVRLLSAYTGTITQNSGIAVTVGAGGWGQAGGIFSGSNANITVSASVDISGGTFTSTSATLSVQNNFTQSGASTFAANSGTLKTTSTSTLTVASASLNNLYLDSSYTTITINGSINVTGNFTYGTSSCCGMSLNAGVAPAEINIQGNAVTNLPSGYGGGGAKVRIVGSGTQTVSGTNGGTFPNLEIASSGTVNFSGSFATNTFLHTTGTVNSGTSTVSVVGGNVTTNGMNFYNLVMGSYNPVVNGTVTVDNDLLIGGSSANSLYLNQGTAPGIVQVKRNITINSYDSFGGGNAIVKLIGTGAQTVTGSAGYLPSFEIANSGGVVTLSGTVKLAKHYTYTSAGSVVTTGSTLRFVPGDYSSATINPGSVVYNNVYFDSAAAYTLSGTIYAAGNVFLNSIASGSGSVSSGTIDVQGNLTLTNYGLAGNASINFSGASNSIISIAASAVKPSGSITVNKTSTANTVTLAGNTTFPGASQDLTITSGTLDMAGYNLTIGRNVTNSDTLKRGNNPSCGVLSYSGSFSGNASVCP